jgi:hypothetical protein
MKTTIKIKMVFKCEKPEECPICYESLNIDEPLSCGHWMHKCCVVKSRKDECPICREKIDLTTEERVEITSLKVKEILGIPFNDDYIEEDDEYYEEDEEYIEYNENVENEINYDSIDSLGLENIYLSRREQYICVFTTTEMNDYSNDAIMYDGRVIKEGNIGIYYLYMCVFDSEFEARNFCHDIEQRYETVRVRFVDTTQFSTVIHSRDNYRQEIYVD